MDLRAVQPLERYHLTIPGIYMTLKKYEVLFPRQILVVSADPHAPGTLICLSGQPSSDCPLLTSPLTDTTLQEHGNPFDFCFNMNVKTVIIEILCNYIIKQIKHEIFIIKMLFYTYQSHCQELIIPKEIKGVLTGLFAKIRRN